MSFPARMWPGCTCGRLMCGRIPQTRTRTSRAKRRPSDRAEFSAEEISPVEIRQRLAFLCHDLRTFADYPDARERLESSTHAHFIGPPYFSVDDAVSVLGCPLSSLQARPQPSSSLPHSTSPTLRDFLEEHMASLIQSRRDQSQRTRSDAVKHDFVLCTSHDLAPSLQKACGFSKEFFGTRTFKAAYRTWKKEVQQTSRSRLD